MTSIMSNSCSIQLHTCAPEHLNFIRKLLTLQGRYTLCVRVGVNMVPVVYKLWVLGLGSNPTVTSTTDLFLIFFRIFFPPRDLCLGPIRTPVRTPSPIRRTPVRTSWDLVPWERSVRKNGPVWFCVGCNPLAHVHGSTISVRLIDPNLYHKLNSANVQLMYACRCEWKCEVVRSEIRDLRLFSSCPIDVCLQMQMEVREIRDPKLNVFINVRLMFP